MKKVIIIICALVASVSSITAQRRDLSKSDPIENVLRQQQQAFEAEHEDVYEALKAANMRFYQATSASQREAVQAEVDEAKEEYMKVCREYVKQNPSTVLAASFLVMEMHDRSVEENRAAYEQLSEQAKSSRSGKELLREINARERLAVGKPAPAINCNDLWGNPFALTDLAGKIVVVQFWASWAKPCFDLMPRMMRLFEKYHGKGLEMVFVGDNDKMPEKLLEAVAKENLQREGIHHVLRGISFVKDAEGKVVDFDNANDIIEKYSVAELPSFYVIGKDGNIIGQSKDIDWLENKLSLEFTGKENRSFMIDGTIAGGASVGDFIVLSYDKADEADVEPDSCAIDQYGRFHFEGTMLNGVANATVMYQKKNGSMQDPMAATVCIKPGDATLRLNYTDFSNPRLTRPAQKYVSVTMDYLNSFGANSRK